MKDLELLRPDIPSKFPNRESQPIVSIDLKKEGIHGQVRLTVGKFPINEVLINDMTVSS